MFAYCNNNPVNCSDPSGNSPKTIRELQMVLNSGNSKYSIMDITKLQMEGYGNSDRFIVSGNGTLKPYTFAYKCLDTVSAFGESLEMNIGVGYGFGASAKIDGIEVEGLMKSDLIIVSYSGRDGLDFGHDLYASIEVAGITIWDEIQYESLVDPSKNYSSYDGNIPNKIEWLKTSAYVGMGFTFNNVFYTDVFNLRYDEIWR